MRKKFFAGMLVKGAKALSPIRKKMLKEGPGLEFKEAVKKHKKLLDKYKNKPLDEDAVKKSYKIFTKGRK
jgi:hypothetical protein